MIILFHTDKTIDGAERHSSHFTPIIEEALKRFSDKISRVEVHLADENGKKTGPNDIRCLIEARLDGHQPIAVTNSANSNIDAIEGAIKKLKSSLEKTLGKKNQH